MELKMTRSIRSGEAKAITEGLGIENALTDQYLVIQARTA
jgi:hypothetical protein